MDTVLIALTRLAAVACVVAGVWVGYTAPGWTGLESSDCPAGSTYLAQDNYVGPEGDPALDEYYDGGPNDPPGAAGDGGAGPPRRMKTVPGCDPSKLDGTSVPFGMVGAAIGLFFGFVIWVLGDELPRQISERRERDQENGATSVGGQQASQEVRSSEQKANPSKQNDWTRGMYSAEYRDRLLRSPKITAPGNARSMSEAYKRTIDSRAPDWEAPNKVLTRWQLPGWRPQDEPRDRAPSGGGRGIVIGDPDKGTQGPSRN